MNFESSINTLWHIRHSLHLELFFSTVGEERELETLLGYIREPPFNATSLRGCFTPSDNEKAWPLSDMPFSDSFFFSDSSSFDDFLLRSKEMFSRNQREKDACTGGNFWCWGSTNGWGSGRLLSTWPLKHLTSLVRSLPRSYQSVVP